MMYSKPADTDLAIFCRSVVNQVNGLLTLPYRDDKIRCTRLKMVINVLNGLIDALADSSEIFSYRNEYLLVNNLLNECMEELNAISCRLYQ